MLSTMRVVMKAFGDLVETECGGFVFMVLEGINKVATFFSNEEKKPFQDNIALNGPYESAR